MEILAPAGNLNQAVRAVEAGCDALYGGLSKWNARNRAINFSFAEYNDVIKYCHDNGVKFYLTLNTLLRDQEVLEIITLLKSGEIDMPDAFIVADMGLILKILIDCPNIPVHVSTQFGASSLEDVLFLQNLGVARVILARELSLNEIKYICENSTVEIEVFVYGSQCVAFSGQCLLGGLLHGASGNRGRCIGMCRDIYKFNDLMGQYLYAHDLDASRLLEELEAIGVCSMKIEGRMRKPREIESVIFKMKKQVSGDKSYAGFLSGKPVIEKMFQVANDRMKMQKVDSALLSKNDLVFINGKLSFYDEDYGQDSSFVKALFLKVFEWNKSNIAIKLIADNNYLKMVDYINCDGERKLYELVQEPDICSSITELYHNFENALNSNIYELSAEMPALSMLKYNRMELESILSDINRTADEIPKYSLQNNCLECEVIYTSNCMKAIEYVSSGIYKKVIYDVEGIEELNVIFSHLIDMDNLIFRLPRVEFSHVMYDILKILQGKRIIIGKISCLNYIKQNQYIYSEIIADYTINAWNKHSIKYLRDSGVTGIIFHPELSFEYQYQLTKQNGLQGYVWGLAYLTVGYTRGCFEFIGCCNCKGESISNSFVLNNVQKGYDLEIKCNHKYGIREIIPDIIFGCNEYANDVYRIIDARIIEGGKKGKTYIELYRRSVN